MKTANDLLIDLLTEICEGRAQIPTSLLCEIANHVAAQSAKPVREKRGRLELIKDG